MTLIFTPLRRMAGLVCAMVELHHPADAAEENHVFAALD